jgi:hypothetical protein
MWRLATMLHLGCLAFVLLPFLLIDCSVVLVVVFLA